MKAPLDLVIAGNRRFHYDGRAGASEVTEEQVVETLVGLCSHAASNRHRKNWLLDCQA